jgi:hypothetical protein
MGAPGRTVLHDDDGCGSVVEYGAYALAEERTGIVIDNDGSELARHRGLSTPW